ncbi:MAG: LLM class flavin-dependent oxidoreductase [Candidatus Rokubacteria bacterium]|nr:LLM class flavin-dependent oxidoreductase [Candidatus Rokubacteria bacterium]
MAEPRFGFFFWPYAADYTTRMASLGERRGWDLVGIADTPGNAMDVWVALALAATKTERVPLAACVTNLESRHPAITAGAAASTDELSGGRLILGVGTGHSGVVNVGSKATAPGAFRDGVAFMRALLAGERATLDGAPVQLPRVTRRVPVYTAASGPGALRTAGAAADGVFVNYGLGAEHVAHARALIADGARKAGRNPDEIDVWWIAALDVDERRDVALAKLGNILGFVAAYILGPAPEQRGVPPELIPAIRELRKTYTTHRAAMDPQLTRRLGLFDYLRTRLAVAGTPDDCIAQVHAAIAAGATRLMFTVSLASDPVKTVELFGREVLPKLRSA